MALLHRLPGSCRIYLQDSIALPYLPSCPFSYIFSESQFVWQPVDSCISLVKAFMPYAVISVLLALTHAWQIVALPISPRCACPHYFPLLLTRDTESGKHLVVLDRELRARLKQQRGCLQVSPVQGPVQACPAGTGRCLLCCQLGVLMLLAA